LFILIFAPVVCIYILTGGRKLTLPIIIL